MKTKNKPRISLHNTNIKKLVFLYDNGREYTSTRIKNVVFNSTDVDGDPVIDYSQHNGTVIQLSKDDLAAITVHYKNGIISTQQLLPCAVIRGKAYIPKKARKTLYEILNNNPRICGGAPA